MQRIVTYATGMYLKSVLRYQFLILDTRHPDTLCLHQHGCEDPWLVFEAKRGPRAKEFGKQWSKLLTGGFLCRTVTCSSRCTPSDSTAVLLQRRQAHRVPQQCTHTASCTQQLAPLRWQAYRGSTVQTVLCQVLAADELTGVHRAYNTTQHPDRRTTPALL